MATKCNSSFSCFFFQTLQLHMIKSWPKKKKTLLVAEEFLQLRQLVHLHREVVGAHTHDTVPQKARLGSQADDWGWYSYIAARWDAMGGYDLGYDWDITWGWLVGISWQGLPRNLFRDEINEIQDLRMSAAEWQEQHLGGMVLEVCYGIFVAKPWTRHRSSSPTKTDRN